MRAFSNSDLLDLWERGSALHPLDRGLLALSAALPEVPPATLADWPLGRRNQALVELHGRCFGAGLQGWSACPSCGEKMEFELDGRALAQQQDAAQRDETLMLNGQTFRLPSSRDLAEVAGMADSQAAAIRLLERCRISDTEPLAWADEDVERVGEQMARADPLAEIRIALRCPACGNQSAETLDIVSFLWEQIQARAKRLLWEVHAIASVYGWTENQVLSLSAARRSLYLQMVQA
ncbi:MAG TPA: hypothetical protein VL240_03415 [Candidatus Binatia bacterium]|nr:hypothetical protein [Candidatus Binatia bacterium]